MRGEDKKGLSMRSVYLVYIFASLRRRVRLLLARIVHETSCPHRKTHEQRELRLSYPKHRAFKPEAQAKERTGVPSLALQA